ncbi:Transcription factor bHLH100 like [Actinidia chinensis var. chinensis]|uniref:Transcription factor bHLH100 like n=1 Tax=Actinidia chinensis var. chinensis TaxID=1590841 RepID=A0A2R6RGL8_ACTCC|nr:Transcription factor bHLH100 like [Actinidia chinensis var. chinensis]
MNGFKMCLQWRKLTKGDPMSSAIGQPSEGKESDGDTLSPKTRERHRRIKYLQTEKMAVQHSAEEGSNAKKKLDHNAKERVRRMKLNASYLALRSLLPNARRSKKKWSAPVIIDRVLEYIPELEDEVEKLTAKKQTIQSITKGKRTLNQNPCSELEGPTVSVNEVREGEVIIQICMARDKGEVFSNLVENVEGEGMSIASASTLSVCEERECHHLHIQMNGRFSLEADYIGVIKDKVVSWLCSFHGSSQV